MIPDDEIRLAVESELRSRPHLDESQITAHVSCGVVRLSGFACSYCEKFGAEDAAKRVPGVAGVVNEIEVHTSAPHLPDTELERAARCALETEVPPLCNSVRIRARAGEVTLEGTAPSHFLKMRAESAVRRLGDIAVVHNGITVEPASLADDVRRQITRALDRGDIANLSVDAREGTVILRGQAASDAERQLMERAAWSVPDVTCVTSEITVPASTPRA